MVIQGEAIFHKKTKVLAHYIQSGQIAIIEHEDIDETAAESLIKKNIKAVINNKPSMTGYFYHEGVKILIESGIHVFDVQSAPLEKSSIHGFFVEIVDNNLSVKKKFGGKKNIATVFRYTLDDIHKIEAQTKQNLTTAFEHFSKNSLLNAERDLRFMLECWNNWKPEGRLINRDVLIVIRGKAFEKDLKWAKKHLPRNVCTIAVDGAADIMLENGVIPDFIIGDMDSITAESLGCGAILMVHKNIYGNAPGLSRIKKLKASAETITFVGMSEDAAIAFALKEGAEKIYMLGGHRDMVEYRSKGRPGMGSSLIMKMFAGSRIIDLKGIHYVDQQKNEQKHWIERLHSRLPFINTKTGKEMRDLEV